jgi:hypothetical protein
MVPAPRVFPAGPQVTESVVLIFAVFASPRLKNLGRCGVGLFETISPNKTSENLPLTLVVQKSGIGRKPFTVFDFSNIVAKSPTGIEGLPVSLPT